LLPQLFARLCNKPSLAEDTAITSQTILGIREIRIASIWGLAYSVMQEDQAGSSYQDMTGLANFLLPNEPTYIVACSAAAARVWRSDLRFGDWTLVAEMGDELASHREQEFESDRPGRSFDIVGAGRHAMSPTESSQDHQTMLFARKLASYLNKAVASGEISHLVLLAAPGFLGHLRSEFSDSTRKVVLLAEPRNLTGLAERDIRNYFK
jgi:protein required for attachment to host cells